MYLVIHCVIITLLSCFNVIHCQEDEEMCFSFRQTAMLRPSAANLQGRPGKTGAPGPPGKHFEKIDNSIH